VVHHKETFAQELCDILVKHGVIKEQESDAMHRAFKESEKEQFDDFLLEEGLVEEEPLLKALGEYFQIEAIDVRGIFFDHLLVRNFPKEFLVENRVIPWQLDANMLIVIASNPADPELATKINSYVSPDIQFRVGIGLTIIDAIREYYDASVTEMEDDQYTDEAEHTEKEAFHDLIHDEENTFVYEDEEEED